MGMKEILMSAPPSQLDPAMFPLIDRWDDEPKAIQVLEVLDHCIHGALASGFVVTTLQAILAKAMTDEGTTHEELVKFATWRDE
jgi:hypothetical protein